LLFSGRYVECAAARPEQHRERADFVEKEDRRA
jgi:hypothetical protein